MVTSIDNTTEQGHHLPLKLSKLPLTAASKLSSLTAYPHEQNLHVNELGKGGWNTQIPAIINEFQPLFKHKLSSDCCIPFG